MASTRLSELLAGTASHASGLEQANRHADSLAYVALTSGSTGWPEAVGVSRRNLAHYLDAIGYRFRLAPGMIHATVAGPAADLGYTALFGALATGGTFQLLSREVLLDPVAYADHVRAHPIDCLKTTPSHLRMLLAGTDSGMMPARHLVILGGEALDASLRRNLAERLPDGAAVVNHYGPTETCIGALAQIPASGKPPLPAESQVPLGSSLGEGRIYLLDSWMRPVPAGVRGEVCIGGPGVSRGYVGQPDLTAGKFRPDPYADTPGARLYRTGDIAAWTSEGELVFLGRLDEQVKIRGYRVEPESLRSQLMSHPAVKDAAVTVRPAADGQPSLVAYLVPDEKYTQARVDQLAEEHVSDWQTVFDNTYARTNACGRELGSDRTGWNSSYVDSELGSAEIEQSVQGTVELVSGLPHDDVLEVGCGTGLLIARIAPTTRRYRATDFSAEVLHIVGAVIADTPERYRMVELLHRAADDFSGIADHSIDLVVLNSVVQ